MYKLLLLVHTIDRLSKYAIGFHPIDFLPQSRVTSSLWEQLVTLDNGQELHPLTRHLSLIWAGNICQPYCIQVGSISVRINISNVLVK